MPSGFDTRRYRCRGLRRSCAGRKLLGRGAKSESEGVLMIITMYGIIVFQLVERISIIKKSLKEAIMYGANIKAFPYPAIRTRHEVHEKPYLQEDKL